MADNKDIEQKIRISYDTNAKEVGKEVDGLSNSIDDATSSQQKNAQENKKSEENLKSFKTQLREATQDLLKMSQAYGETSKEAITAAKKVAELKDQMQFSKDLVDNFNPDQKFKALGAATQLAGTGLQGVTSGMALFGDQSEDTQKQLLKVQAAMAFSDALSNLSNVADQFEVLKTTVKNTWITLTTAKAVDTVATEVNTVAQVENEAVIVASTAAKTGTTIATTAATIATNLWNASLAIALAPITLIVAGVAALVLGIGYLTGAFGDFSGAQAKAAQDNKALSKEIDNLSKSSEKANEEMAVSNSNSLAMAKAHGASAEAIRKLSEELIAQEVAEKKVNAEKARSIFLEAKRIAGLEDATDAQKETATKAAEFFLDQNKTYKESLKAQKQLAVDHSIEIVQEQTDRNEKLRAKQAEAEEERRKAKSEAYKKALEDARKASEDLAKELAAAESSALRELQDLNDKTDQEKLDRKAERDLQEILLIQKHGGDIAGLMAYHNELQTQLQDELDAANRQKELEKNAKKIADRQAFDEEYYTGKKEFSDAVNEQEVADILEHQLALQQIEQDAATAKVDLDGGTPEEVAEKKQQINEFYKQKEIETNQKANDAILGQKKAFNDSITGLANQAFSVAKDFAGKNKKAQKAILIAENALGLSTVVINTLKGVSKAMSKGAAGIPEAVIVGVSGALSAVKMITSTAKGLKELGGGDAGSAPTIGSPGAGGASETAGSATPQVGFQSSTENQIATTLANNANQQPIVKAFVVSSEVTTAQGVDRNKTESNSF
jgi:hypothetical protein